MALRSPEGGVMLSVVLNMQLSRCPKGASQRDSETPCQVRILMVRKQEEVWQESIILFPFWATLNAQDKIFRLKKRRKWRKLEVGVVESSPFHMEIFSQSQSDQRFLLPCSWKRKWGEGERTWPHSPLEPHDPFPMWHIPEPWKGEGRGTKSGAGGGKMV